MPDPAAPIIGMSDLMHKILFPIMYAHAQAMQLYTLENIVYAKSMHVSLCTVHTEHANMHPANIRATKIA
jgi:hypothetical protein